MRAERDPGARGASRHRTRRLRARPLLRSRRPGAVHHTRAGLHLSGDRLERRPPSRSPASERAALPCRFEVARVPPLPPGPFDVVLLLETMLAFADKETLLRGDLRRARRRRAVRLHPGGGAAPHAAERERMPDADTVWLTPLDEMRALLGASG